MLENMSGLCFVTSRAVLTETYWDIKDEQPNSLLQFISDQFYLYPPLLTFLLCGMCAGDLYMLIYFACEEWEVVYGEKKLKNQKREVQKAGCFCSISELKWLF